MCSFIVKVLGIFAFSRTTSAPITFVSWIRTPLFTRLYSNTNQIMPKKPKGNSSQLPESKKITVKSPVKIDPQNNILVEVYAKPGAKQNAITDVSEEGINIQINAPPVEGSANTELVKYMASFLGLKSNCVSLERGHRSRNKVLKISGSITRLDIIKKINAELPAQSHLPEN